MARPPLPPCVDLGQFPAYYSCPLCDTLTSSGEDPPNVVVINAQVMGICSECAEGLWRRRIKASAEPVGFRQRLVEAADCIGVEHE